MWPNRIELAFDGLSFYFDEAVEIIRWDVDKTLNLLVHELNCMRKDVPHDD